MVVIKAENKVFIVIIFSIYVWQYYNICFYTLKSKKSQHRATKYVKHKILKIMCCYVNSFLIFHTIGVDYSDAQIELARELTCQENISFVNSSLDVLPFEDSSIDCILE